MRKIFTAVVVLGYLLNFEILPASFAASSEPAVLQDEIQVRTSKESPVTMPLEYTFLNLFPKNTDEKLPLLMVFHGSGQKGKNYFNIWQKEAITHRFMLVSPEWEKTYHNMPADLSGMEMLLKTLIGKYPIDKKKIYLGGVSSGARLALSLVLHDSQNIQGVFLIASSPLLEWIQNTDVSRLPPFLYIQGEKDTGFPAFKIQNRVKELRQKGGTADLIIIPGAGHEHRPEWNQAIFEWIERQKKAAG